MQNSITEGGALATAAASGVALTGGTVANYLKALGEFNDQNVRDIADSGAAQAALQRKDGEFRSRQLRRDGQAAQTQGIFDAVGSVLRGFG